MDDSTTMMRQYMRLIDGALRLVESAETDYPSFEAEWGDYIANMLADQDAEDQRELTFEWYDEVRQELEHHFSQQKFMYRTIHIAPNWLDQLRRNKQQPLGVYWSIRQLDWQPSTSAYDERFSSPKGKTAVVKMTARVPAYQAIDWNASVASAMVTMEDELRVRKGAAIELTEILVDDHRIPLNLTRPA